MQKTITYWSTFLKTGMLSLLLLLAAGCTNSSSISQTESVFRDTFEPCQLPAPLFGRTVTAECGWLSVFEDPAAQDGSSSNTRQIDLYIAILPAISRTPLDDPLFFIAGGPGQAATESYGQLAPAFADINQTRDIVLVDQRGTGKSNPLSCPITADLEEEADPTDEQIQQWLSTCADKLDADPTLYTTTIAIQDLDRVRAQLGYAKINLFGVSYGTRVALTYADTYPEQTRSMTLDGVVPADQPLGQDVARNAQSALDKIFQRCQSDSACSEAFPNLADSFAKLMSQLDREPIKLTMPHPISGESTEVTVDRQAAATVVRLHSYAPEDGSSLAFAAPYGPGRRGFWAVGCPISDG